MSIGVSEAARDATDLASMLKLAKGQRPATFRPSEIAPDLFLGGLRDCSPLVHLVIKTRCRLVLRCCAEPNDPPFRLVNRHNEDLRLLGEEHTPLASLDALLTQLRHRVELEAEAIEMKTETETETETETKSASSSSMDENKTNEQNNGIKTRRFDSPPPSPSALAIINIPAIDNEDFDLMPYFDLAANAIDAVWSIDKQPVVIFCQAGMSRSVSALCAFLMRRFQLPDPDPIVDLLRSRRTCCNPNPGFRKLLRQWASANAIASPPPPQQEETESKEE